MQLSHQDRLYCWFYANNCFVQCFIFCYRLRPTVSRWQSERSLQKRDEGREGERMQGRHGGSSGERSKGSWRVVPTDTASLRSI